MNRFGTNNCALILLATHTHFKAWRDEIEKNYNLEKLFLNRELMKYVRIHHIDITLHNAENECQIPHGAGEMNLKIPPCFSEGPTKATKGNCFGGEGSLIQVGGAVNEEELAPPTPPARQAVTQRK